MVRGDAPGRVNLMGEHTDYNRGLVLPTVLPHRTVVELTAREDLRVRVRSLGFGEAEYALGGERPRGGWLDYVQGCTAALLAAGHRLRGFDAEIRSDVPVGAGVSSSAALEVALLRALREAFQLTLDDVGLARVGQEAENAFVGARVGIMDQLVASLGRPGTALFLDTADLRHEVVPLPASLELAVIDSGVAHDHADGRYNARRAECEEICRRLGIASLRELPPEGARALAALPERLARRARHVARENERVRRAVAALRAGDAPALGALFDASHASQRDDYEVSTAAVDRLAEVFRSDPAVYGARLTGGGFGGAIVAAVHAGEARAVALRVSEVYERSTTVRARIIVPA